MLLHRTTAFQRSRFTNAGRHWTPGSIGVRRLAAQLPPRIVISEDDIQESFLKGSGPGGQKINKTSSAVQLKHLPTGMVVKSQATRSRSQNRSIARRLLADKLEDAEKGSESRTALKSETQRKKKASKAKKARRKHRTQNDPSNQDELPFDQDMEGTKDKTASVDARKSET
ncbi:MAG: hypothetical protein L6R38_003140 [Xanthoria sp. 2 TBL-2021]|nr:MAG: hypothetical protein L6R38_003140 [Xanthoria sp. 2 TBL-2021]